MLQSPHSTRRKFSHSGTYEVSAASRFQALGTISNVTLLSELIDRVLSTNKIRSRPLDIARIP